MIPEKAAPVPTVSGEVEVSDNGRDDDGILGRWSRRKRAARQSTIARPGRGGARPVELARVAPPQPMPAVAADAEARLPAVGEREPGKGKAPADLPPVDQLDKNSDYTRFLEKGVPEALKRQALKRLWSSDPQFHVVDPFTEYGGDYTVVVPIGASLYKPGLGYLTEEELEQQKNLRAPDAVAEGEGEAVEEVADAGASEAGDAAPTADETTPSAASPSQQTPAAGEQAPDNAGNRGGDGDAQPDSGHDPAVGAKPSGR